VLSILLPIYNHKVVKLVDELIVQCAKAKISFEIICLDDKSQDQYRKVNRIVNERLGVNYVELSENLGRAKIRNRLAMLARYDWVILLDADVKLKSKKFIKRYLDHISEQVDAIVGGIIYAPNPPKSKSKRLHWTYGTMRESRNVKHRKKHPERYFLTANLCIKRDLLLKHPFDESLMKYGYEDILMGAALREEDMNILHIDNPITHRGIKKSGEFISGQKEAVANLASLYFEGKITSTRLIDFYERIKGLGIKDWIMSLIASRLDSIEEDLMGGKTSLKKLDCLKLYYFDISLKELYNQD